MQRPTAEPAVRPGSVRRKWAGLVLILVGATVAAVLVALTRPAIPSWPQLALLPRLTAGFPDNAEWDGNPAGPLTATQVAQISRWDAIEVLPKFDANYDIEQQFTDARRLVAAAHRLHRHIAVYAYFSAAFWLNANTAGWGRYARSFRPQWLLRDAQGRLVPYYGVSSASTGAVPDGYVVDLGNPAYRAWAVHTVVAWMKTSALAGIAFDSANPLIPAVSVRPDIANGSTDTYQQLLCGTASAVCPALASWNAGLRDLLAAARSALHRLGGDVLYNGIAPSIQHGPGRNLGLLRYSEGTANEGFCFRPILPGYPLMLTDVASEVRIMQRIAGGNRFVLEMADHGNDQDAVDLGGYCFGAFLMGWQPGHAFFVFHSNYNDPLSHTYPEIWQQRLNFGSPLAGPQFHGDVIVRRFQLGFVAVNTGYRTEQLTAPSDGIEYRGGRLGPSISRGTLLNLAPHSALYALDIFGQRR